MFSQTDLHGETAQKLSVVCMSKLGQNPLRNFRSLLEGEKKKFNKLMNIYIQSLGEDWKDILTKDFNEVCTDEVFTENFRPNETYIKEIDTEIKLLENPNVTIESAEISQQECI